MSETVIILGAKGRFGRAASKAFYDAGWNVRRFARNWPSGSQSEDYTQIEGDAFDLQAVTRAAMGCDIIVNALNPSYQNWKRDLPKLTASVIQAAKSSGATIMIPGNVYNYGQDMPEILSETTPYKPTTRKGKLRVNMEQKYANAASQMIQTIILRGGDFIEKDVTGNWFDSYIASKVDRGIVTYPGPTDKKHAWAYLPDMARAMVLLADKRKEMDLFETFGFEGFNLTGDELINIIENATGVNMQTKTMPWPVMRILGLIVPTIREVVEMQYLWNIPHMINGSKLSALLPEYRPTPIEVAIGAALPVKNSFQISND